MHPEFLQKSIELREFDIGFAFDGDGDRIICVLNDGEILDGDKILFILAVLMKEIGILYGNTIVATTLTNFGVEHSLEKQGIKLKRVQVGDKNVSICLQSEKLPLGGEKAGHIIISEFAKTGDGIYSALYMLKLLKLLNKTPQEVLQNLIIYPATEIDVPVNDKDKHKLLNTEKLQDAIDRAQNLLSDRGRIVVRASGTENKIRILVEGKDESMTVDLANYLKKTILQLL
jgi:phosphoglucosamine mutase